MKIMVTGGAGYIGSHAVLALANLGHDVVVVDNLVYGHARIVEAIPGVELLVGDIGDRAFMKRVFATHAVDAVMHFSAYAYVGESVTDPSKYYRNNVAAMLNLLDEMTAAGVSRIVFSSTCATYGIPESLPLTESSPQHPINPYGAGKQMAERILKDYENAYGLKSIVFRYFNAAGADPQGRSGENHDPETHLIPLALDAALGRRKRLTIFGGDYPTPDGTCIRDYVHVSDLADAHVLGLQTLLDGEPSGVFNLGNGQGHSVLEVVKTAERVVQREIPVDYAGRREGDPPVLVADCEKAHQVLGWEPAYSELETIIRHAWQWHRRTFG